MLLSCCATPFVSIGNNEEAGVVRLQCMYSTGAVPDRSSACSNDCITNSLITVNRLLCIGTNNVSLALHVNIASSESSLMYAPSAQGAGRTLLPGVERTSRGDEAASSSSTITEGAEVDGGVLGYA